MKNSKEFILPAEEELTGELLAEFIQQHKVLNTRYKELRDLYQGEHSILTQDTYKPEYKPDNRIVVNYAKYLADTFNGYFIGIPVVTNIDSEQASEYIQFLEAYNNLDDHNAELSKKCDIYGHGYELLFHDELAEIGIISIDPRECFIIYDDSIRAKPRYGVRYQEKEGEITGTYSDTTKIYYFSFKDGKLAINEEVPHYFEGVPIIEYVENKEKIGVFEPVETLINALNKAISEKANDVDYFADAYMKILGAELDEETQKQIKSNRIINMVAPETTDLIVEFMEKPSADVTQENLITHLKEHIFTISMVANITDEKFGNASGVSLAYKLQNMSNLAKTKERKFVKGFNERYKLISSAPKSKLKEEDVYKLSYKFTRNAPNNLSDEADTALKLSGLVSDETAISTLSVVENVADEMARKEEENRAAPTYDEDRMNG